MDDSIEQILSGMDASQLIKIVVAALNEMDESNKIDFIAKHIEAQMSLSLLSKDDPDAFLKEVCKFYQDCVNNNYYSDDSDVEDYFTDKEYYGSYYDDDWDYNEFCSNTKWVEIFTNFFKLSIMYIRSGDITTGYKSCEQLLSILTEAMDDDAFFGTNEPDLYIKIDWNEFFDLFYSALFQYQTDTDLSIKNAFHYWSCFGERCTEGFLANVKDINTAERYIIEKIKSVNDWTRQYLYFNLLEQLYSRLGIYFDKTQKSKALLGVNKYFYQNIIICLFEQGNWQEVISTANIALTEIPVPDADLTDRNNNEIQKNIRSSIQLKLTDSYEKLQNYEQAFETLWMMFNEYPDFGIYIRARSFAEKTIGVQAFLDQIEAFFSVKTLEAAFFNKRMLRLSIFSYEGAVSKMLNLMHTKDEINIYSEKKFVAHSLVYRAMEGEGGIGTNVSEYIARTSEQDGIKGMLNRSDNMEERTMLLLSSVGLLSEFVAFHISAATRSRYAKAAYYMCVIRDIYIYIKREDEFRQYFQNIISQNNRRTALRDEMSVVFSKRI